MLRDKEIFLEQGVLSVRPQCSVYWRQIAASSQDIETLILVEIQFIFYLFIYLFMDNTRVGTLIVATIYLQMIQNRYMFRSFTVLQCSHQHCVQPVASDVEVVGYL